jgi:hypothetical protein
MTKKKFTSPEFIHWQNELDAALRHNFMHQSLVMLANDDLIFTCDTSIIEFGNAFTDILMGHMDALQECKSDAELSKLVTHSGSLEGMFSLERFLEVEDHFVQVLCETEISSLSASAQDILYSNFPIAVESVEKLMLKTGKNIFPPFFKSKRLNNNFYMREMWLSNDLVELFEYNREVIKPKNKSAKPSLKKPDIICSNKDFSYIDAHSTFGNKENCLSFTVNVRKILSIGEPNIQDRIINHSLSVISQYLAFHKELESALSPEESKEKYEAFKRPIAPPITPLVKRYDRYESLIIGLYCLERFHPLAGFTDFEVFIKEEVFDKIPSIKNEYKKYVKGTYIDSEENKAVFIRERLMPRLKKNMASAKTITEQFQEEFLIP